MNQDNRYNEHRGSIRILLTPSFTFLRISASTHFKVVNFLSRERLIS